MFARFQKYVYICTKNVTPRRRYTALTVGKNMNLRDKIKSITT
jgi:hypothetical protein